MGPCGFSHPYSRSTHLQANPTQDQGPFSWIKLIQQGTSLASLSCMGNLSHCFICAALGKTPLVAIPLPKCIQLHQPRTHTSSACLIPLSLMLPYLLTLSTINSPSVILPLTHPCATSPGQTSPLIMLLLPDSFGAMAPYLNLSIPLPRSWLSP